MAFKPTREQLIAQTTDRHLAVTANAGSGKTKTLVDRYVNLLISGVEVSRIVAITFTRKAAAEMHARVVGTIEELKEKAEPEEIGKFRYIRERLTNAKITTIHSFCSSLLREFAIEAGISPFFTELPQSDKNAIFDSSFDSLLEGWLGDPDRKDIMSELILSHGRKPFKKIVQKLCGRVEIFQQLEKLYGKGDEEIFGARDKEINIYAVPIIEEYAKLMEQFSNELKDAELKGTMAANLINFEAEVRSFNDRVDGLKEDGSLAIIAEFADFIGELKEMGVLISEYNPSQKLKKHISSVFLEKAVKYAPKINTLMKLADSLLFIEKDGELLAQARFMFGFTKELIELISDEKKMIPAIDFDDMLLKTREILDNPIVRKKISMDLSYILVDEFQDTNELQYQIIKKLSPALSSLNAYDDSVNVYLVGDEKQSIYGFRYADVRVFMGAKDELSKLNAIKLRNNLITPEIHFNGEKIETSVEESSGLVNLSTSFRLQPVIAAFINRVFGSLMKDGNEFEVAYNPLVASRGHEVLNDPGKAEELISSGDLGTVRFIMIKNKDAETVSEEEEIARCIKNMINGENKPPIFDKNGKREPRYKDITILARSRNHFKILTDQLRSYSIPFLLHSGQGFFETPEVRDVISFVRFLYNNNDDIAFAGFLKSSFIGMNDTMLYKISKLGKNDSLINKLRHSIEPGQNSFSTEEKLYLQELVSLLNEFTEISGKISLTMLILKLIEESGWLNKISSLEAKTQMKLNVTKFIDYARKFEERGFRNLFDFVRELDMIADNTLDESEAAIITDDDAVNIMTIHASKGLEFPIVILMNTSDSRPHHAGFEISSEFGLTYKLPMISEESSLPFSENTPLHQINLIRKDLSESAEDKRILYVALTRARDHLVITGAYPQTGPSYFLGMIINNLNIGEGKNKLLSRGNEVMLSEDIEVLSKSATYRTQIKFPLMNIGEIELSTEERKKEVLNIVHRKFLLDEIKSEQSENFFSATAIMLYLTDREEFIRKYRFGATADLAEKDFLIGDTEDGDVFGARAGIIIHRLLENINKWMNDDGKINTGIIQAIVGSSTKSSGETEKEAILKRTIGECRNIASSPLIIRMKDRIKNAEFEYKCTLPIGLDFLTAQFDLIVETERDGQQCHEVWDWKSNLAESDEAIEELANYYSMQMKVYAYIASLMYPTEDPIRTRLLFTRLAGENTDDNKWTRELVWTREELSDFSKELNDLIAGMKAVLN